MIKTMNDLFFELIQVALGVRPCLSRTPKETEWGELYNIAKKQSLVGICFAGVQKLVNQQQEPPEMLYLTWMGMAAKIQQKNEIINKQCIELQKRLDGDGYRNYIMKGQSNAALYGDLQMLRQSGDIDIYLEGGLEKVLAYAKTFGDVEHVNELEMSVPVYQDTEVEFHYRPFIMRNPFKNAKLQAYFKSCEETNFSNSLILDKQNKLAICAPTMEFNLVHQLAHIHLHLFTEGIGMRQLMDYYFVLLDFKTKTIKTPEGSASACASENLSKLNSSATQTSADSNAVGLDPSGKKQEKQLFPVEVIEDLGLNRFASALMWVLGHVFGLERECMLWEPNKKDGRLLLDEVMTGGNFGRHNEEQNDRKGKMGYSVWALFIRNLKFARFDRGDWFWGPVWRICHKLTRKKI